MKTVATCPGTMQHCLAGYDLCSWIGKVLASQVGAAVPDLLTKLPCPSRARQMPRLVGPRTPPLDRLLHGNTSTFNCQHHI